MMSFTKASDYYKIYSSPVRSRLEARSPLLEAVREAVSELQELDIWKFQPSIITDMDGVIVADNGVE